MAKRDTPFAQIEQNSLKRAKPSRLTHRKYENWQKMKIGKSQTLPDMT